MKSDWHKYTYYDIIRLNIMVVISRLFIENFEYKGKGIVMGKCFSDAVETALRYIYYDVRLGKGAEGLELLKKASEEGDGDASCILARCMWGPQYVWNGHNFPEDDELGMKYLYKSVEQGSALGVMVAVRCNEFSQEMAQKMPFANLKEAFAKVLEKANAGDAFCQYTIGNSYYWGDFLDIDEINPQSFSNNAELKSYVAENTRKCEEWFLKALRGGIHSAANNLNAYYTEGVDEYVAPQPAKAKGLYKMGAELGHPDLQWSYAEELEAQGKVQEGFEWRKKAAEGGQTECWYDVAEQYRTGKFLPKDLYKAAECYEKCINQRANNFSKLASANQLGRMYCEGEGVMKDYTKALPLIKLAVETKYPNNVYYLGKCYYGMGEYEKARTCFENSSVSDMEVNYMLGMIYTRGLGVAENIDKGIKYLKNAKGIPEAKMEIAKYKKPFLGKWVRK